MKPRTPNSRESADKHSAIIEAAAEVFLDNGYLGASMDDIANRAGVAKQTVYSHFAGKKALFVAMASALSNEASDRVQSEVPEYVDGDVERYLTDYAVRQLNTVLVPRILRLRRLVIGEVTRFPELGVALYSGGPGRAIESLAATIKRLSALGALSIVNPTLAATQFNWLVMSAPLNRAMLLGDAAIPDASALCTHAAESVRMFLAAYGAGERKRVQFGETALK
jgi:TetR/AcrR family transcriptional regulator, mexJK operon transcriptional repressor